MRCAPLSDAQNVHTVPTDSVGGRETITNASRHLQQSRREERRHLLGSKIPIFEVDSAHLPAVLSLEALRSGVGTRRDKRGERDSHRGELSLSLIHI